MDCVYLLSEKPFHICPNSCGVRDWMISDRCFMQSACTNKEREKGFVNTTFRQVL